MNTCQNKQEQAILDWKNNLVTLLKNITANHIKITDIRRMKASDGRQYVIVEGVITVTKFYNFSFLVTKDVSR